MPCFSCMCTTRRPRQPTSFLTLYIWTMGRNDYSAIGTSCCPSILCFSMCVLHLQRRKPAQFSPFISRQHGLLAQSLTSPKSLTSSSVENNFFWFHRFWERKVATKVNNTTGSGWRLGTHTHTHTYTRCEGLCTYYMISYFKVIYYTYI